jgi:hypothetical protein
MISGISWSYWDANDTTHPYHRPCIRIPPVAGQRNRLTSLVGAVTTKTPMTVATGLTVRDGEPGKGAIIWAATLACSVAGDGDRVTVTFGDVNPLFGSVGLAMACEFYDVLPVSGTNDYSMLGVTGVSTTDSPPSDMWKATIYGSPQNVQQNGVTGQRLCATYVQAFLRQPPTTAGNEVTLGMALDALPLAQGGKGKPLWAIYAPRPSSKWGILSVDMPFYAPVLGEVGGPITVRADTVTTGGWVTMNVWGRTVAVGGSLNQ